MGTKWDELLWFSSIVQLLWSEVWPSPPYAFLIEVGPISSYFLSSIVQLLWSEVWPSPPYAFLIEVEPISFLLLHNAFFERVWSNSLDFHSLCNFFGCLPQSSSCNFFIPKPLFYLVFGQFPQGKVAMLCECLPWQSLPQFWIFIQCAISQNSNAFWTNKQLMEIGKMLTSLKFEHLSFKLERPMETKVLKWNRLIFKLIIL